MNPRIILITGASSGIGEALTQEWARKFPADTIVVAARGVDKLQALKNQIAPTSPAKIVVQKLDLESPASVEECVRSLRSANLIPDVVIHNAGLSQRSLAKDTSIDVDRRIMEVNYFGTVLLTKLLLPDFLRRGHGQFAVITSLAGKFGVRMRSGYCGSKHALHGFFDSLRAELAADYGRDAFPVTMVCPGFIHTPISLSALTGDGKPQRSMDQATGSGMDPHVFARRMIAAIQSRKIEVAIGGRETMGVLLKRFVPGVFTRMIEKVKVV